MSIASTALPALPFCVGRYELILPIASGGMATVYLARVQAGFDFEREVAVKLVHPHLRLEAFERELVEEAKLTGKIRHPNVVQTLDVGESATGIYLVMDYVEGDALSALMPLSSGISTGVLLRLLADALKGLHAAHELRDAAGAPMGVVHRDFTPQNILVGLDGVARLGDFGVAKAVSRFPQTATGVVKGKFGYMAPEQALAQPLDRRSDVWAAGVIAWEIVARRRLHEAGNDASTLLAVVTRDAPRLATVAPEVPPALDDLVARALERDPKGRVTSAEAFCEAIERACEGTDYELAPAGEVVDEVGRALGEGMASRRRQLAAIVRGARSEQPGDLAHELASETATVATPPESGVAASPSPLSVALQTQAMDSPALPTIEATFTIAAESSASSPRPRKRLALAAGVALVAPLIVAALLVGAPERSVAETSLVPLPLPAPSASVPKTAAARPEPLPSAASAAPVEATPPVRRSPRRRQIPAATPASAPPPAGDEPLDNPWRPGDDG